MPIKPSPATSRKASRHAVEDHDRRDYPLQGTKLDITTAQVRAMTEPKQEDYFTQLLKALAREIRHDRMALKARKPFKNEMRDLRRLATSPTDAFLLTDDRTYKRNILGKGAYGGSHVYWSRQQIWKMKTKQGDLRERILRRDPKLVRMLVQQYRKPKLVFMLPLVLPSVYQFLQFQQGNGTAFPPFHARFFADKYLPPEGGLVIDPCAGWGGRLLGTLCVPRAGAVEYVGVDPNRNNKFAYEGLTRRVTLWLRREIQGKRSARIYYRSFEEWIRSASATRYKGKADLIITSPPYFVAENYDPSSRKQSANRYTTYVEWRDHFYLPLMKGAYNLLKPNGVFVLNIADVREAKKLETDARKLAKQVGFVGDDFYKLAMSLHPALLKATKNKHHLSSVNGKVVKHEPVFVFRKLGKDLKQDLAD